MVVEIVETPLDEVCAVITGEPDQRLFMGIMNLFIDNGLSYRVKRAGPDSYRIYCFIKKAKEALILNTSGNGTGGFVIQLRVKDPSAFDKLDGLSANVRDRIIKGKDCKMPHCCNCGSWYAFTYRDTGYRKCHMLCDNFALQGLDPTDHESVLRIITDEIAFGKPKRVMAADRTTA